MKPRVLVFSGYGLNCEEETKYAFEYAKAKADIVHINDLIDGIYKLKDYQILAFPGGFSYGDDTGSGNAYANKVKNHLWKQMEAFLKRDTLIIGICNGFQIITNLGMLPAFNYAYGTRESALLHNATARYIDRWVDVTVSNDSPWLKGISQIPLVISHGEGKLYADEETLKKLSSKNMIALRYCKGEICEWQNMEANPTGTVDNICGITNENGKIFGLMPHPERAMFFTQLPHWTFLKEKYKRDRRPLPTEGPGMKIFKNAVEYFR